MYLWTKVGVMLTGDGGPIGRAQTFDGRLFILFVRLLLFYVIATSKVLSGQAQTLDRQGTLMVKPYWETRLLTP